MVYGTRARIATRSMLSRDCVKSSSDTSQTADSICTYRNELLMHEPNKTIVKGLLDVSAVLGDNLLKPRRQSRAKRKTGTKQNPSVDSRNYSCNMTLRPFTTTAAHRQPHNPFT